MPAIAQPALSEYPVYYRQYVKLVEQQDLIAALTSSADNFKHFILSIPDNKLMHRYASGKWNIKEIVGHIIDAERVFAYRALRFSRNDKTPLPGFDENAWAPESNATGRDIEKLIEEYDFVRKSSIGFFSGLTTEMGERNGSANGNQISVRALGYIIAGHEMHHAAIIKERYFV